jgi:hypothetical protein
MFIYLSSVHELKSLLVRSNFNFSKLIYLTRWKGQENYDIFKNMGMNIIQEERTLIT